jgi:hypothetical protein
MSHGGFSMLGRSALAKRRKAGTITADELAQLRVLEAEAQTRHRKKARQPDPEPVQPALTPEPPRPAPEEPLETPEELAEHERKVDAERRENIRICAAYFGLSVPEFIRQGTFRQTGMPEAASLFKGIDPTLPTADIPNPPATPSARITDAQLQQFYEFNSTLPG